MDISLPLSGAVAVPVKALRLRVRITAFVPMLVFGAGFALAYGLLTRIPGFIGTDDYYHSRIATQIIEQHSLRLTFPWLPLTILSPERFVDHHLLYHLYLAPWMYWGGIAGAKLAQSLIVGAIGVTFWSLLRFLRVHLALVWTLALLAISTPFLYRMLMIRTQAAAVLLLLLALHVLFRGRYRWLVGVAFAFTWLYNGFILLPVIAALYMLATWVTERRFVWQPVAYALLGVALGLVINPYFPQNIAFVVDHLGEKMDIASSVRVGSEWYPYTTLQLLDHSLGALLVLGAGLLADSFHRAGRDKVETTLLLIALLTLFMLFESRRFIEYYPVFALLFCAVAWGRRVIRWRQFVPAWLVRPQLDFVPILALVGVVAYLGIGVVSDTNADIQNVKDVSYLSGASAWLASHTEPGELIFQTDWDDFTRLFYYNTHNVYLVGLDPTYLQVADPFLWNQWVAITQGVVERPSVLIRDTFGARYVVSDTQHQDFAQTAEGDPNLHLVYRDATSMIWYVDDADN
ncbi:MAG: hypothetical protein H6672_07385 [Anaerolineaceae bacterium]|nr:hypothetical protein [Anaerolineaceae bacterium]